MTPKMNGIRQPQSMTCSGDNAEVIAAPNPVASRAVSPWLANCQLA